MPRLARFVKYSSGLIVFALVIFILHVRLRADKGQTKSRDPHLLSPKIHGSSEPLMAMADEKKNQGKEVAFATKPDVNIKSPVRDAGEVTDSVNYNVHAFYYAWYGNPGQDGQYSHWNHEYLPHWLAKISAQYPTGQKHVPPDDIGSSFYPLLGPYSSLDESITRVHMLQMRKAGIGVLALSWYPPGQSDDNGKAIEPYVPTIFDIADEYNIKVCFHIEPYKDRSASTMHENIKYILDKYGQHPAFYRRSTFDGSAKLPLMYVYDSYLINPIEWQKLLTKSGTFTIRDTELDSILIGLLVEGKHMGDLINAGFDGVYTYFAADGFSYGSAKKNWLHIAKNAQHNNLIFIPSVGPGYDDTKVRPWNTANSHKRKDGAYYEDSWRAAIGLPGVDMISITSFNEWHEGTQIEPAASETKQGGFSYLTYGPHTPEFYLELTKTWSMKLFDRQSG